MDEELELMKLENELAQVQAAKSTIKLRKFEHQKQIKLFDENIELQMKKEAELTAKIEEFRK